MVEAESGGLGLPRMAERMEYSRFAASDPKAKLGSNETLKRGSFVGNGSAADMTCEIRTGKGVDGSTTCRDGREGVRVVGQGRLGLELLCWFT